MPVRSMHTRHERIAPSLHLALVAVQIMFASLATVGKVALRQLPPTALITARVLLATLVLCTLRFVLQRLRDERERVEWRDLPELGLHALFGVSANMLIFIEGLQRTTATNAVVIGTLIPVFTVAVAVATRKEAATPAKVLGLAVAFAGAMVIVGVDGFQAGSGRLLGNLLIVGNSLSFSIYLVISRRLLAKYRPMTVVTWTFILGSLGVLPFGGLALAQHAAQVNASGWLAVLYIVLFPTVSTYFLNVYALKRAPSSLVAIYIYLQPVMGALMAAVKLHERPSAATFAGAGLIGCGTWLVTRAAQRAQTRSPAC
jgi:drug/metabolite transporter (DMT)-like permease